MGILGHQMVGQLQDLHIYYPKMMVQNLNSFYGSFLSRMLEFEWKPKDRCVPSGLAAIGSATSEVNGR